VSVLDSLSIFQDDPLLHEPGTAYAYTSYGFNLIGAIVEAAAGQPFLDYLRDAVFYPLSMRDTTADFIKPIILQRASYYVRDASGRIVNAPYVNNSYKWAGGGLLSTTEDILRFANAHMSRDFLSDAARDLLFTEQITVTGERVGYGFGWFVQTDGDGRRLLGHSGGAVGGTSLMLIQPETRVAIVGLINLTSAQNGVLREVLRIFVEATEASLEQ
jgi:CubicO group peptidase (beta-lactamase class C family)